MLQRVLEIGAGQRAAILNPGTLLADPETDYSALDVQRVDEPGKYNFKRTWKSLLSIRKFIVDASITPLHSDLFDHIIFRSVFGAYTPNKWDLEAGLPYEPNERGWQGSTWVKTLASISESYRLLKPGGTICIAEEDTPIRKDYLLQELARVGFSGIQYIGSDLFRLPTFEQWSAGAVPDANPAWLAARGIYWANTDRRRYTEIDGRPHFNGWQTPAMCGHIDSNNPPYLLLAAKP